MSQDKNIWHTTVTFKVICQTSYGESIYLLGNIKELHSWDLSNPIKLRSIHYTTKDPLWETEELILPANTQIQYKFFKKNNEEVIWEFNRDNREFFFTVEKRIEVLQTYGISHKEIIVRESAKSIEEVKNDGMFNLRSQNVKVKVMK